MQKARFTFNTINARAAQNLLIPRAVSYSAGLINWFFRGKIDMVKDPANPSQYLIKNLGTEPLQGTFTLYYDNTGGVRDKVPGGQWTSSGTLTAGQQLMVSGIEIPADATSPDDYMLVFEGGIGVDNSGLGMYGIVAVKVNIEKQCPLKKPSFYVVSYVATSTRYGGYDGNYCYEGGWNSAATIVLRIDDGPEVTYSGTEYLHQIDSLSCGGSLLYAIATHSNFPVSWALGYLSNGTCSDNNSGSNSNSCSNAEPFSVTKTPILLEWEAMVASCSWE